MNTIIQERLAALDSITLAEGQHDSFEDGHCAMEVVAWLAGLGHTDAPECASEVLRDFTIRLNDQWRQEDRQRLVPFLPLMVGTANDGQDEARAYLALDWLIHTHTPAFLELAGRVVEAAALRDLAPIVDEATATAAVPVVHAARDKARAAGVAAGVAALDAAGVAAGVAARDALAPTVETLKTSALELLGRMIDPANNKMEK